MGHIIFIILQECGGKRVNIMPEEEEIKKSGGNVGK